MALSVLQHIDSTSTSAAAGGLVPRQAWPSPTLGGSLLVALLTTTTNFTTICNTPGWKRAVVVQNGATQQTELWYKNFKTANDQSPTFQTTVNTSWYLALAEVRGFSGYTLDKTGTATGTTVSTLATAVGSAITTASEFVIAGYGVENNTSGAISMSASSAGGSASFGADIDNKSSDGNTDFCGGVLAWATTGAAGTSPSITFNNSAPTNSSNSGVIATFIDTQQSGFIVNNLRPAIFKPGIGR